MPSVSKVHPTSVQPCLAHLDRLCPTLVPHATRPQAISELVPVSGLSSYVAVFTSSHSVASQLSETALMPFVSRAHPTSVQPCLAHLDRLCTTWVPHATRPQAINELVPVSGLSSYVAVSHSVASQLSETALMPSVSRAHPTSVQPCLAHLDRLCPTWVPHATRPQAINELVPDSGLYRATLPSVIVLRRN